MTNSKSFGEQFEKTIVPILINSGFRLVRQQRHLYEVYAFERQDVSASMPDRVTFHGSERGNYIYCQVVSGLKPGLFLKTLKELLPNFFSFDFPEYDRWDYSTEEELEGVLREIADLIEHKLLDWFQNPVQNPSGISTEPKIKMTREESIKKTKETIAIFEGLAKEERNRGNIEEAGRYEEAVRFYQQGLLKDDS